MDLEKKSSKITESFKDKPLSKVEFLEIWLNTINHGLIGITTFYMAWYCYIEQFSTYQLFHAFFASIGYSCFMSEGIMAMYNRNTYTMFIGNRRSKVWVHLVLQMIGSGFALFAVPYEIFTRESLGKDHFGHYHNVIGEMNENWKKSNHLFREFFMSRSYFIHNLDLDFVLGIYSIFCEIL